MTPRYPGFQRWSTMPAYIRVSWIMLAVVAIAWGLSIWTLVGRP